VQERAKRAVHQRRRLLEREVAHVALAQVEVDARLLRRRARLLEHRRRAVGADHPLPDRPRDRNCDPTAAHGQLDHGAVRLPGELDVERDVLGHVLRPLVVDGGEPLVELGHPVCSIL
jgi:hypothetical protein